MQDGDINLKVEDEISVANTYSFTSKFVRDANLQRDNHSTILSGAVTDVRAPRVLLDGVPREFGCYEKLLVAPRPQRDNLQRNFIAYLVPTK